MTVLALTPAWGPELMPLSDPPPRQLKDLMWVWKTGTFARLRGKRLNIAPASQASVQGCSYYIHTWGRFGQNLASPNPLNLFPPPPLLLFYFPTHTCITEQELHLTSPELREPHSPPWTPPKPSLQTQTVVLPLGWSDVEPAQLAWQSRLAAALPVEPGRVVVLDVQHLLGVHGVATSPGGHWPPALGRPVVLEEKEKQTNLRFIVLRTTHVERLRWDVQFAAIIFHMRYGKQRSAGEAKLRLDPQFSLAESTQLSLVSDQMNSPASPQRATAKYSAFILP